MVWIHGGGFYLGSGSQYDGSELASKGVIVVTINYRLGIFGFLSNEDDVIPGNFGMLDQIMALKWVKDNIGAFGGDPKRVTIFGQSAGSGSVSLLILSPLASGLFHKAIMESGVSISSWAVAQPALRITPRTTVSLIGSYVGCSQPDTVRKLQCLRKVDADALLNASQTVQKIYPLNLLYSPVVENVFSFMPDFPVSLLSKGKFNHVDTIHGFNADEMGTQIKDKENDGISKDEFAGILKENLAQYAFTDRDKTVDEIVSSYIGIETDRKSIRYEAMRALSDYLFNLPTVFEATIQSRIATDKKHYLYEFQYRPSPSRNPSWLKATHGQELYFVFGTRIDGFTSTNRSFTEDDILIRSEMMSWWSNFAKYGNPTQTAPQGVPSWAPFTAEGALYMKIDTPSHLMTFNSTKAEIAFTKLFKQLQILPDIAD